MKQLRRVCIGICSLFPPSTGYYLDQAHRPAAPCQHLTPRSKLPRPGRNIFGPQWPSSQREMYILPDKRDPPFGTNLPSETEVKRVLQTTPLAARAPLLRGSWRLLVLVNFISKTHTRSTKFRFTERRASSFDSGACGAIALDESGWLRSALK